MSFFQGTLQQGIGAAVQQGKSVLCFVTDNATESKTWEEEYLVDDSVAPLIESQAVSLRLEAGSQEEGFLTQLYPIPKKPTIVIIKNGELKEYIAAGVSKEVFLRRILGALQPAQPAAPIPVEAASSPTAAPAPASVQATPSAAAVPISSSAQATTSSMPAASVPVSAPTESQPSPASSGHNTPSSSTEAEVQPPAVPSRREEEEARKKRVAKGKRREEAPKTPPKISDEQRKHAEILKKKQQEAREERARILKAIEDDKAARRARQAEKEAERRALAAADAEAKAEPALYEEKKAAYPKPSRATEHCSLQVRLLDGGHIRNKFSSHETLANVREWVDKTIAGEAGGHRGKTAYLFKILLTPLPSKTVDVTEEGKSLQELGLTPSATLIHIPVVKSAGAYAAAATGGGNVFSRAIIFLLALVRGFLDVVVSFFSTLFSTAGPPQPAATSQESSGAASGRDGTQTQGLRRTGERRNDQQFYNGNSTNFEPRPDDEDE
ncbi:UBX domain-containing protein 4 [Echria macrotheca]|uniref:UBX domain-containing protein 2 n=1 Tax=Echria macrotheca TaxID=438768 RepID=A0AAJ0FCN4_9PEZI|nr:UBX domain-containing protein 4 [Echria macrotheca]